MTPTHAVIHDHPFFQHMRPDHVECAARGAREVTFAADQVIFHEGDPATEFYLIQAGRVALEARLARGSPLPIQTLAAGDVLGWSWLFAPFCWHFQARAREPVRAVALNGARLLVACEENHALGYALMKRVAQVIITRLQATRRQLLDEMSGRDLI
jgi:CRP-like cAMP-binding protein